jgi:6-pyruvoyltetrahydropterin/6-carboxytetrahydropterin synthase
VADLVPRFSAGLQAAGEVAVTRAKSFEAAHRYRDERFGKAARLHGHNFTVSATIAGPVDPSTHFVVDFRKLDALLSDAIAPLDHRRLDTEYAALDGREPSTEALAGTLFGILAPVVRSRLGVRLARLRVAESDDLWSERDEGGNVELTRAYEFSAAHRLADPSRSDEENRRLYGKCANPEPHGHAYRFEVTVRGEPDRDTGLVADVGALDEAVRCKVLDAFDHRYLNVEVPPFDDVLPTAERIAERIWALLAKEIPHLARVVVYETPRSAFAYVGREER